MYQAARCHMIRYDYNDVCYVQIYEFKPKTWYNYITHDIQYTTHCVVGLRAVAIQKPS